MCRHPNSVTNGIPDGIADGVSDGVTNGGADEGADGVPDGVPDGIADEGTDGLPDGVSHGIADEGADSLPDRVPDRLPYKSANHIPHGIPDGVAHQSADDIPHGLPDRVTDYEPHAGLCARSLCARWCRIRIRQRPLRTLCTRRDLDHVQRGIVRCVSERSLLGGAGHRVHRVCCGPVPRGHRRIVQGLRDWQVCGVRRVDLV